MTYTFNEVDGNVIGEVTLDDGSVHVFNVKLSRNALAENTAKNIADALVSLSQKI